MSPFDADPDKPLREILSDVRLGAIHDFNNRSTSEAIPPFAALLVRIAEDADKTAKIADKTARKIVTLTWGLIFLTILLLVLTGMLAWKEYSNGRELIGHESSATSSPH